MSLRFFSSLARYLDEESPAEASTDAVFVVLIGRCGRRLGPRGRVGGHYAVEAAGERGD
jgi:hypothetical protein